MVAIRNQEADRFLERPAEHFFAYLVFGNDAGLVRERARLLFRKFGGAGDDAFSTVRLSGDDIAADPGRLADEAYSIGLFGGKRTIWVEAGSRNIAPSLEKLFDDPPKDSIVIVETGALKKDAALRVLFERSRASVAIECYPDSPEDLSRLVNREVAAAGLTIAEDVRAELVRHLGSDRAASRAELDKLILYAHGADAITFADIETVVADASTVALDGVIAGPFLGQTASVTDTAARAFGTGNDPGVLLGFALRHALALMRARASIDAGGSQEAAMGGILRGSRSPVLRKQTTDQLAMWSQARLLRAIDTLAEAVRRCRREANLAEIIAVRALWSIALAAKAKN